MAEWQTRKLEVFVERSVLVQVQLSAPKKCETIGLIFFCANNWCASTSHQCFFKQCTWTCIRRLPMRASTLRNILAFARIDKSSYPHQTKQIRTKIIGADLFCLVFLFFIFSFFTFIYIRICFEIRNKKEEIKIIDKYYQQRVFTLY